jgi:glycosyltransferase involved in cell wall biosynthesis
MEQNLFFLGVDRLDNKLGLMVEELGLSKHVIFCGLVEEDILHAYLEQATINVVASLDEGFGLSIIEGFVHGLPTVMFSDLDAVKDLYDEKVICLVQDRTDEALLTAINNALQTNWDNEYIKKYSERFSLDIMANRYQDLYHSIVKSSKC